MKTIDEILAEEKGAFEQEQINNINNEQNPFVALSSLLDNDDIDSPVKITVYHGSPDFKGEVFDLNHVGDKDGISDARGFAVYMTTNLDTAKGYAGAKGSVVEAEIELDKSKIASLLEASSKKELLKQAIENSPLCVQHLIDCGYERNESLPSHDGIGYEDPKTGEYIEISQPDFAKKFGGLAKVFENRFNYDSSLRTSNVVALKIANLCDYSDHLAEALLSIEADMYSINYHGNTLEQKLRNRDLSLALNQMKIDNGVDFSLEQTSDDEFHITGYNLDKITIKSITPTAELNNELISKQQVSNRIKP